MAERKKRRYMSDIERKERRNMRERGKEIYIWQKERKGKI